MANLETPLTPFEGPQFDGSPEEEYGRRSSGVVICSGGLDSTTAATIACHECEEILLLHFLYGCKAESAEKQAVSNIRVALNKRFKIPVSLQFIQTDFFKNLGGSTIVDPNLYEHIATGEKGATEHGAWVPARNLVMLSLAAALCDAQKIGRIYLGTNREEAQIGKFPDNSGEFIDSFNETVKLGTLSKPDVIAPLRNLMKIDIVKKALEVQAPIHLSHSCYHERPCENPDTECGPCRMRRLSFAEVGVTLDTFRGFYPGVVE